MGEGGYCTDTFLPPQSWNSFRQTQPFISLFLLLCLCHIPWVINAKAHREDTNSWICSPHTCAAVHAGTHMYTLSYSLIFLYILLCFPINPLWWCPDSLNLIWWDVKPRPSPHHDAPTHLWDACIWERAASFNRCCVPPEGARTIKSSY